MRQRLLLTLVPILSAALIAVPGGGAQSRTPNAQNPSPQQNPSTRQDDQKGTNDRNSDRNGTSRDQSTQRSTNDKLTEQSFIQQAYEANQNEVKAAQMAKTRASAASVKSYAQQLETDHTKALAELRRQATTSHVTLPADTATSSTGQNNTSARDRSSSTSTSSNRSNTDTTSSTSSNRSNTDTSSSTSSNRSKTDSTTSTSSNRSNTDTTSPTSTNRSNTDTQSARSTTNNSSSTQGNDVPTAMARTADSSHMQELSGKSGAEFDKAFLDMMVEDHQKAISLFEQANSEKFSDAGLRKFVSDQLPGLRNHLARAQQLEKEVGSKNTNSSNTNSSKSNSTKSNSTNTNSTNTNSTNTNTR